AAVSSAAAIPTRATGRCSNTTQRCAAVCPCTVAGAAAAPSVDAVVGLCHSSTDIKGLAERLVVLNLGIVKDIIVRDVGCLTDHIGDVTAGIVQRVVEDVLEIDIEHSLDVAVVDIGEVIVSRLISRQVYSHRDGCRGCIRVGVGIGIPIVIVVAVVILSNTGGIRIGTRLTNAESRAKTSTYTDAGAGAHSNARRQVLVGIGVMAVLILPLMLALPLALSLVLILGLCLFAVITVDVDVIEEDEVIKQ